MEDEKKEKKKNALIMLLNKYYKLFILIIIILFLAAGYFTIISSKISQIKEQKSIGPSKELELSEAEEYYSKLIKLEELINDFEKLNSTQLAKLEEALPNGSQVPELLAQLEAFVESNNFALVDLSIEGFSAEKKSSTKSVTSKTRKTDVEDSEEDLLFDPLPANIKTLKISLTVTGGDYFAFKDFLASVEKHIRIFDVTSLSFGETTGGAAQGYTLELQTYYFES